MSKKLTAMLKHHEGSKTHAYKCTANKVTIGVGRNIDKDGGLGLSKDEINYLLRNDIERVEDELSRRLPFVIELSDVRLDALIDICFNLGLPRFLKFKKALRALENHDYDLAAREFMDSRWATQVGQRAVTVCNMIRTGKYKG